LHEQRKQFARARARRAMHLLQHRRGDVVLRFDDHRLPPGGGKSTSASVLNAAAVAATALAALAAAAVDNLPAALCLEVADRTLGGARLRRGHAPDYRSAPEDRRTLGHRRAAHFLGDAESALVLARC